MSSVLTEAAEEFAPGPEAPAVAGVVYVVGPFDAVHAMLAVADGDVAIRVHDNVTGEFLRYRKFGARMRFTGRRRCS